MIDYINANQSGFWIALGFLLLSAEILVFGFSTIVFMFAGLGGLITGFAMILGVLPETWTAGIACFGISTGLSSALLWKPLSQLQNSSDKPSKQTSDLIGYEFVLQAELTPLQPGLHRYSGVDWKVELDRDAGERLDAGQRVVVTAVDAGLFRVKAT